MKKIFYLLFMIPFLSFSQVGIGTQNPTRTLDVDGELRVRTNNLQETDSIVTVDGQGNYGYRLLGSMGATGNYQRVRQYASNAVVVQPSDLNTFHNINLSVTITIPANYNGMLEVRSSVPAGMIVHPETVEGYVGTALFKNGVDLENPNRKVSLEQFRPEAQGGSTIYRMNYIIMDHFENVTNSTSNPITITFEARGYIEHYFPHNQDVEYIFNKWLDCSTPPCENFNWGRGYIEYELKEF